MLGNLKSKSWLITTGVAFLASSLAVYYRFGAQDLFAVVFVPAVLFFLLTLLLSKDFWDNLLASKLTIKHDQALHEHGLFWVPIVIFGWAALWVGLFSTEFNPTLLVKDPLLVVSALKIPTSIFALCIPFTVAIGRFHASSQQKKALEVAEETKSFQHYFDHREAFIKYIGELKMGTLYGVLSVGEPLKLYEMLYPNSTMTSFKITGSPKTDELLVEALDKTVEWLEQFEEQAKANERTSFLDNGSFHFLRNFGVTDSINSTTSPEEFERILPNITRHYLIALRLILEFAEEFDRQQKLVGAEPHKKIDEASKLSFDNLNRKASEEARRELQKLSTSVRRIRTI